MSNNFKVFKNKFLIINTNQLGEYLKETKKYIHMNIYKSNDIKIIHTDEINKPIYIFSFNSSPTFMKINKDELKNKTFMCMDKTEEDIKRIRYVEGQKYGKSLFYSYDNNSYFVSLITKISKLFKIYSEIKDGIEEEDDVKDLIEEFKEYINKEYTIHKEIQYEEITNNIFYIFETLKLISLATYSKIEETIKELIEFIKKIYEYNDIIKKCPLCRCDNKIIIDTVDDYKKLFIDDSNEECCICMNNKVSIKLPSCSHQCLCYSCFSIL